MTLHKSMWKAAVLMGIAGVLLFAGGAVAKEPNATYSVVCSGLSGNYGSALSAFDDAALKQKCTVFGSGTGAARDTLWRVAGGTGGNAYAAGSSPTSSFIPKADAAGVGAFTFALTLGGATLISWDATKADSFAITVTIDKDKLRPNPGQDGANVTAATELPNTVVNPVGRAGIVSNRITLATATGGSSSVNGTLAADIKALYTWTPLTTWLGSGRTFSVGTNLADLELPTLSLRTGLDNSTTKNGKFYYRFVGTPTGESRALDTLGVPGKPGAYDIYVSFGSANPNTSANHDSTNIKGTTVNVHYVKLTDPDGDGTKKFTVRYQPQDDWAVLRSGDTAFVYNSSPTWTLRAPGIDGLVGTADTVIYTASVTAASGTTAAGEPYAAAVQAAIDAASVKSTGAKGSTFEFRIANAPSGTVLAGGYTVTADIIGKDAQNKYTWKITGYTFKVVILPKPLTSSDITITVNGDGTQAYTYNKAPQSMSVTVRDGGRVLTIADTTVTTGSNNDFAVNRKLNAAKNAKVDIEGHDESKRVNAGPASVWIEGAGNYKGIVEKTFTIQPKGITYALKGTQKSNKVYDGTAILGDSAFLTYKDDDRTTPIDSDPVTNPKGGVDVTFTGLETGDKLFRIDDYKFTTKSLNLATVGTNRTATIVIALDTGSAVAKNYKLNTSSITVTGIDVIKRVPATHDASHSDPDSAFRETFKYSIPTHYFWGDDVGTRRGIGSVTYQTGMTNPGATPIRVLYTYPGEDAEGAPVAADFGPRVDGAVVPFVGDTTRAPRLAGSYAVKAVFNDSSDVVTGARSAQHITSSPKTGDGTAQSPYVYTGYELGTYTILPPGAPTFAEGGNLPARVENRLSRTVTLRVSALPFNYAPVGAAPILGTLSYQWWRGTTNAAGEPDSVKVGGNRATYEATTTDSVNSVTYWVHVFNGNQNFQNTALGMIKSTVCEVAPLPPPKSINGRVVITLPDSVVYNGANQTFVTGTDADAVFSVNFFEVTLNEDGSRDTAWTALDEQVINGNDTTGDYRLIYSNNRNVGTANILVVGRDAYTGSTSTTFKIVKRELTVLDLAFVNKRPYTGEALGANVRPVVENETGMGAITVTYNGQAAVPVEQGVYNLVVSVAAGTNYTAASNLSLGAYEIGMGVLDSSCFKYETMQRQATDPNLSKGIGAVTFVKGTGFGDSIIITYEGDRAVPTEKGEYEVYARVLGGANFPAGNVHLGTYKIVDKIAVAEADRQIPKTDVTEVVTIAPLPVKPAVALTAGPSPVKLGGEIKFFSMSVKSAIYIFDANGSSVAKLSAKPGKDGAVAVWNLKDKKGVTVSEGTYVAVAKDGREKVSFKFSVVK